MAAPKFCKDLPNCTASSTMVGFNFCVCLLGSVELIILVKYSLTPGIGQTMGAWSGKKAK